MPSIAHTMTVTVQGHKRSVQDLKALVANTTFPCVNTACANLVKKADNACSMQCMDIATTPEPPVEPGLLYTHFWNQDPDMLKVGDKALCGWTARYGTPAEDVEQHVCPECVALLPEPDDLIVTPTSCVGFPECADKTCIDVECNAQRMVRKHLLMNKTQDERPAWFMATDKALASLFANSEHGDKDADFFFEAAMECATHMVVPGATATTPAEAEIEIVMPKQTHVQKEKDAIEATPVKVVRKKQTKEHQPRTTDGRKHPVTTINTITMTAEDIQRAVAQSVADIAVRNQAAQIVAAPVTPAVDKPVEVVKATGGRAQIERITAGQREFRTMTLPAIVVSESLTIPALEVSEESVDTLVSSKVRSPYNKARTRLGLGDVLDKETTTYRSLVPVHDAIKAAVEAQPKAEGKAKKAKKVKKNKTVPVAVVDTDAPAKRLEQIAAIVAHLGKTWAEAEAMVDALA